MSWILSDPRVSDWPGGSDFLDLAELRAWAGRHNFLMLVEALPEAASGPRIQRAMLPAYIRNHVSTTIGDDLAESLITAEPEKYANFNQRMCESAPALVYAKELTRRLDASIQTAIDQGEIIPFDAAGMPVERRPRPTEARLLALDEQMPEAAIPTPSPAPAPPLGVVKARIIGAFEPPGDLTNETWEKALGDAKRIEWLKPARVFDGRRGTSALWNPAMLAFCLCEHYRATPQRRRDYGRIIEQHFPDWLPEWKEYDDSLS